MKAEENNHLCRLSFRKTSSEFKCSVREGCNFSDKVSQNQACLRHLNLCWHKLRQTLKSLLGILAKWLYSKHCQTVSYYTIVYLLDKYLFYLTTVVSKQKNIFGAFLKQNSGSERWLRMEAQEGLPSGSAAPWYFLCAWVLASPCVSLSGTLLDWGVLYHFSIWQCYPGVGQCWWMVTLNCAAVLLRIPPGKSWLQWPARHSELQLGFPLMRRRAKDLHLGYPNCTNLKMSITG